MYHFTRLLLLFGAVILAQDRSASSVGREVAIERRLQDNEEFCARNRRSDRFWPETFRGQLDRSGSRRPSSQ